MQYIGLAVTSYMNYGPFHLYWVTTMSSDILERLRDVCRDICEMEVIPELLSPGARSQHRTVFSEAFSVIDQVRVYLQDALESQGVDTQADHGALDEIEDNPSPDNDAVDSRKTVSFAL
jgi:hypothetical protein